MPVGIALAGAAVLSAGVGIYASNKAANTQSAAATQAADAQLQASREAAALQLHMFDTIRGDLSGYRGLGADATAGYRALLGLPGPAAAPAPTSAMGGAPVPGVVSRSAPNTGGEQAPRGIDPFRAADANGNPLDSLVPGGMGGSAVSSGAPMKAGDFNWAQVLKDRPDVQAQYDTLMQTADRNSPWFAQHGLDKGPEGFAQWWYNNRPAGDMRPDQSGPYMAPQWTQAQIDALYPATGAGAATGGAGTGASPGGAAATPANPLDPNGIQTYLESLPGYKFVRDQGIKSTTNALSTKGLGGISGPMAKGISRFVTGLADTTYGDQVARLAAAVNTGAGAATQTGGFGTSAASNAGSSLVAGGNAIAGGITGAANANAAGTIGTANAIGGAGQGIANAVLTSRILATPPSLPAQQHI